MNEEFELVKINLDDFTKHHDECLEIANQLFLIIPDFAALSPPLATLLMDFASRLDKSISKLPVKFD